MHPEIDRFAHLDSALHGRGTSGETPVATSPPLSPQAPHPAPFKGGVGGAAAAVKSRPTEEMGVCWQRKFWPAFSRW
jgi:hypothetical protein